MSKRRWMIVFGLLTLVVLTQVLAKRHNGRLGDTQSRPFGRYTEQQAVRLAEPVLQALLPQQNVRYIVAQPHLLPGRDGKLHRVWSVAYTDANGKDLAETVRDADTGLLWIVGCSQEPSPKVSTAPPLSPREAIAQAQDWIYRLGFRQKWLLVSRPKRTDLTWSIVLHAPGRRASVVLDRNDGNLLYAKFGPVN